MIPQYEWAMLPRWEYQGGSVVPILLGVVSARFSLFFEARTYEADQHKRQLVI